MSRRWSTRGDAGSYDRKAAVQGAVVATKHDVPAVAERFELAWREAILGSHPGGAVVRAKLGLVDERTAGRDGFANRGQDRAVEEAHDDDERVTRERHRPRREVGGDAPNVESFR